MFYAGAVGIQRSDGGMCLISSLTCQDGRVRLVRLATGAVRTAKAEDILLLQPRQFLVQFNNHMLEMVSTSHSLKSKTAEAEKPIPASTIELIKHYFEIVRSDPSRKHECWFLQEFIISSVWHDELGMPITSRIIMVSKIQNVFGYIDMSCPSKSLLYCRFVNLKRSIALSGQ